MLNDLRLACSVQPEAHKDRLAAKRLVAYSGKVAAAEAGTVAVSRGDIRFIFAEGDVRRVEKQGDFYQVWVDAGANVLVRIETVVKASEADLGAEFPHVATPTASQINMWPFEVCEPRTLCFPLANGRQFCFTVQVCHTVFVPIGPEIPM